jgi:5-methylcytosine-specific restriction protein A
MPAAAVDPARTLPWRSWYSLQLWRRLARHQLREHPLCTSCMRIGRVTVATIADHDPPHGGNWNLFRLGKLQSLCADCHNRKWADDAHGYSRDIGLDGLPLDPRHPFNRGGQGASGAGRAPGPALRRD